MENTRQTPGMQNLTKLHQAIYLPEGRPLARGTETYSFVHKKTQEAGVKVIHNWMDRASFFFKYKLSGNYLTGSAANRHIAQQFRSALVEVKTDYQYGQTGPMQRVCTWDLKLATPEIAREARIVREQLDSLGKEAIEITNVVAEDPRFNTTSLGKEETRFPTFGLFARAQHGWAADNHNVCSRVIPKHLSEKVHDESDVTVRAVSAIGYEVAHAVLTDKTQSQLREVDTALSALKDRLREQTIRLMTGNGNEKDLRDTVNDIRRLKTRLGAANQTLKGSSVGVKESLAVASNLLAQAEGLLQFGSNIAAKLDNLLSELRSHIAQGNKRGIETCLVSIDGFSKALSHVADLLASGDQSDEVKGALQQIQTVRETARNELNQLASAHSKSASDMISDAQTLRHNAATRRNEGQEVQNKAAQILHGGIVRAEREIQARTKNLQASSKTRQSRENQHTATPGRLRGIWEKAGMPSSLQFKTEKDLDKAASEMIKTLLSRQLHLQEENESLLQAFRMDKEWYFHGYDEETRVLNEEKVRVQGVLDDLKRTKDGLQAEPTADPGKRQDAIQALAVQEVRMRMQRQQLREAQTELDDRRAATVDRLREFAKSAGLHADLKFETEKDWDKAGEAMTQNARSKQLRMEEGNTRLLQAFMTDKQWYFHGYDEEMRLFNENEARVKGEIETLRNTRVELQAQLRANETSGAERAAAEMEKQATAKDQDSRQMQEGADQFTRLASKF